jgi:hypothetical protein
MDELKKIGHLLHHWKEHNDEHAESYKSWAEKMSLSGNERLSKILTRLYEETKKLNILFDSAIEEVNKK